MQPACLRGLRGLTLGHWRKWAVYAMLTVRSCVFWAGVGGAVDIMRAVCSYYSDVVPVVSQVLSTHF